MDRDSYDLQLDIALRRGDADEVKRLREAGPQMATDGKYAGWEGSSGEIPTNNPGTK